MMHVTKFLAPLCYYAIITITITTTSSLVSGFVAQKKNHENQQFHGHHQPIARRNANIVVTSASLIDGDRIEYAADAPYEEASYDPIAADAFFRVRPLSSIGRFAQIVSKSGGFVASTVLDQKFGREEEVVKKRSQELLELVSTLGPTFIKVGQALSARTDLLPAKYAEGLTRLQDEVPPFPADLGRAVVEKELNIKIEDVFSSFSSEPVAAASIGQVYRGTLRATGEDVAVKVQRPKVLENVALDLFMLRSLAPIWQDYKEINTDLVGLVDAWGEGFVNELDYRKEAEATKEFSKAMESRGLGSVFAPEVVDHLSSKHVLTTKWVDGTRLASSDTDDVPRLCGVALNAYLTMLLDTGTLHCDPHPGNLLRTPEGKLCILDWGMVLDVPEDLQLSLLEFIANLNAENYEEVPNDLVKLSFVPADKLVELRESGLTVAISNMIKLAGEGGGPKGAMKRMVAQNKEKYAQQLSQFDDIDSKEATELRQKLFKEDWKKQMADDASSRDEDGEIAVTGSVTTDITMKMEQMQQQNADVFAIPDYCVYMSRAFSTLEGIGLSSDSNYSILNECFPYLAKRLLSDDSPRARGALKTLVYGDSEGKGELNLSKLQDLSTGLESYTVSTSSVESGRGTSDDGRNAALEQLTSVILSEESNYVQSLLLHEAAAALDATVRDAIFSRNPLLSSLVQQTTPLRLLQGGHRSSSSSSPPSLFSPSSIARSFVTPLTLPFDLVQATLELQSMNDRDNKRLENVRILTNLVGGSRNGRGNSSSNNDNKMNSNTAVDINNVGKNIGKFAREAAFRRNALARIGVRFGGSLASVQAERLRNRLDEHHKSHNKPRNNSSNKDISAIAERLAISGAEGFENLADAISTLDNTMSKR